MQYVGAVFAGLLGLAFGSFLNVVVTRLPEDESVSTPRSHCRNCAHTLAWWENLPILSWLLLRGRCRSCQAWIGIRYPLVELSIGLLWTVCWLKFAGPLSSVEAAADQAPRLLALPLIHLLGYACLSWLLVALAVLDAEHFWLPDRFTLPGAGLGLIVTVLLAWAQASRHRPFSVLPELWPRCVEALLCAFVVLLIRWTYWLVRRKEGMGLGDAKLMAMAGAWLGLLGGMESFALAVLGAATAALVWLAILAIRGKASEWARMPLPFGTFICLAALSEIFFPGWLWMTWSSIFLR